MITTPLKVLTATSDRLNEKEVDTTAKRLRLFDAAMHHVLGQYKWEFARKKATLNTDANVQKYDLEAEFSDYDCTWGIHEVWIGDQCFPVEYEDQQFFKSQHFTLTPDRKEIIFTKALDGTETVEIWYYARHVDAASTGVTLNVKIPEAYLNLIVLYIKYLVHDGKRQRNDARNAILDFQEVLEQLTIKNASQKAKHLPKVIGNPLRYAGVRRVYTSH